MNVTAHVATELDAAMATIRGAAAAAHAYAEAVLMPGFVTWFDATALPSLPAIGQTR